MSPGNLVCPSCGYSNPPLNFVCLKCNSRLQPKENVLAPHPNGIDELALRINAAVLSGRLSWGDVAFTTGASVGVMADIFQGRAPSDPDLRVLLEVILDEADVRNEGE